MEDTSSYCIPSLVSQWPTRPPRVPGPATAMVVSTSTVTTTLVVKTESDGPLDLTRN